MRNILPRHSLIADTGFWVALANPKDRHHRRARQCFDEHDEIFVSTWPVIVETSYLLYREVGLTAQVRFLRGVERGGLTVFHLDRTESLERMEILLLKYAELPMDIADASLVLLAEELGHGRILSTDQRDFHAYRWKKYYPFTNLLL